MGDYDIDLINGFKISRINGQTIVIISDYYTFEEFSIPEDKNPKKPEYIIIFLLMLILVIGIMNYLLVYRFSLKKVYENEYIDQKQRKKMALLFAILNIPYFVYIPIGF